MIMEFGECLHFVCSVQFWRMGVMWTLSLIYSYFQLWLDTIVYHSSKSYPRSAPSTQLPISVVTGATSGLGAAAALSLSFEGFYVVLAARSNEELDKTVREIKKQNPDAHLKAFQVDLSSFESMLLFKRSLQQWLSDSNMHFSIQLLVNNAGILATTQRFTVEGFDQMIATNYVGAFCLTNLLLPLLKSSRTTPRVVNVTSFTHRCVPNIQVDKETLVGNHSVSKQYPYAQVYEYTKVLLLLFSYELHRQFCSGNESHRISVMAADPGVVETNIMREVPSHISNLAVTVLRTLGLSQSSDNGVESIIDAALAPPEESGQYFFGGRGRFIKSSALSYDTKLAEKLWNTSSQLFLELQLASKDHPS